MTPDQWQRVNQLCDAALELSGAKRAAFLQQECADDEAVRREVEELLAAHEEAGTFLQAPAILQEAPHIVEAQATILFPTMIGHTINQYKIKSSIGKGGMGEVYLAEDTRLGRKVALKFLPAQFACDTERVRRFEQEARAASALNHPNIITVHDIGECEAGRFIVMEHVAGRTIRSLTAEKLPLDSVLAWGSQIAKALCAAHAANIIHRDIKPDNIMVRDDGYVKVLDFGLARLHSAHDDLSEASLAMTTPGTVMGTVKYMSPEQTRGEAVTTASDIFALGIVLYELATGQHPFNGGTLLAVMQSIATQSPIVPSQLNPELPAELDALLLRMLEKDARLRLSATEVDARLEATRRHRDTGTRGEAVSQSPRLSFAVSPRRHTVGRQTERAELQAAFDTGRSLLLCVAGEPGIGKTTLVEDFLTELAAQEAVTIVRGRCSERLAGTEAYLPLLEALESLLRHSTASGSELGSSAQMMRQLAPTWYAQVATLSGEDSATMRLLEEVRAASQERMKRELATFLQELSRRQPLVIFFDDLHWADVSTIDLLSFLASKFDTMRVLIVVTYRPSDMLLAKHSFLQIKPDLQTRGVCHEIALEFLNEAEIAQYLALEFPGHRFPTEFPKLIHAKTEGSPLFMADLVRYLRDRGVIAKQDSQRDAGAPSAWTLAQALPDIERELPESVRGMIERKIAQLNEEDCKLLTAASVQGYEFDSAVVAQVLSIDADEVEERLEKLERIFAFVKLTSESEFPNRTLTLKYRFVHVLYQNALYASLRATRRVAFSRDVGKTLERFYAEQCKDVANELAALFETAREYAKAAEYFLLAARQASQVYAPHEAGQLVQRGLAVVSKLPESKERNQQELSFQVILGNVLLATRGYAAPDVAQTYARIRELCQQTGETQHLLPMLYGLFAVYQSKSQLRKVLEVGEEFLTLAERQQDLATVVAYRMIGLANLLLGELKLAHKYLGKIVSAYDPTLHRSLTWRYGQEPGMSGYGWRAWTLWLLGYPEQALADSRESLRLAGETPHALTQAYALGLAAMLHQFRREPQMVLELAEKQAALSGEQGLVYMLALGTIMRDWAKAKQGDLTAGIEGVRNGLEAFRATGADLLRPYHFYLLAEMCGKAGQISEGLAALVEGQSAIEKNEEQYWAAELHRLRGELLLTRGANAMDVEQCFQQAIEIAQRQQAKSLELRATMSLAQLWQRQGKITEARQMLAEIYGWFTEGFDTADLQEAKALLDELQAQTTSSLATTSDNRRQEFNLQVVRVETEDTLKRELLTPAGTTHLKIEMPSIAVLPFVNISNDPDNEYFCDGLAEELLNALSKIEALHVAARTSAFSFKGKEADIREIGQKLNVGAVLEGSVRKAGNRLRITAQLINVADGYHLWSERYDREMQDIFDIQDEISLAIVDALKVKLLGAEKAAVLKRYTDDTEAYQLYLKGRYYYGKWTEEGFRKAIGYFEKAIEKDPNYAPAVATTASSYLSLWFFGYLSSGESMPLIKASATKAMAMDQSLAESHLVTGRLKFWHEWDWTKAEQEFKQAIELTPNYAEAHEQYSLLLAMLGRVDEAVNEGSRALELDPLSLVTNLNIGWVFWLVGQYEQMENLSRKLLELEPNFWGGHWLIGIVFWTQRNFQMAVSELEKAVVLGGGPIVISDLGALYGVEGKQDKARQVLEELQDLNTHKEVPPFYPAKVYAGLGEKDRAFDLLTQCCEQHDGNINFLKPVAELLLPIISSDPRFADLLRRIGLPQ